MVDERALMHFLSPSRPRLGNGAPSYPLEKPLAALPALRIYPEPSGYRLELMLIISEDRTATNFTKYVTDIFSVGRVIEAYRDDPEAVMKEVFGWGGIGRAQERLDERGPQGPDGVVRVRSAVRAARPAPGACALDGLDEDAMGV